MKKSVYTYRIVVTMTLMLFCTAIHQNLDAGFHMLLPKKEVRKCKAENKSSFADDNFVIKILLRFSSAT